MSITMSIIPASVDPADLTPPGAITMWHGTIADIPAGWVLCNGSNGTPDLRGRFVQGAADGNEANDRVPGGSATATPANHSAHSDHTVTQASAHSAMGTHQHLTSFGKETPYNTTYFSQDPLYGVGGATTIADTGGLSTGGADRSVYPQLTQAISAGTPSSHSGTAVNAHSAHSAHSTSDSRPPFYTILYIMKT